MLKVITLITIKLIFQINLSTAFLYLILNKNHKLTYLIVYMILGGPLYVKFLIINEDYKKRQIMDIK